MFLTYFFLRQRAIQILKIIEKIRKINVNNTEYGDPPPVVMLTYILSSTYTNEEHLIANAECQITFILVSHYLTPFKIIMGQY